MNKILLVTLLVCIASCGRLPAPVCRQGFLPSVIPVSLGQTVRVDLQNMFDGYNLVFDGMKKDHISVTPKYLVNQSQFSQSFNFTTAKIKQHGRFLGLNSFNDYTQLAIGVNHPESGVTISTVVHIQDMPQLHCYDVDQIIDRSSNKVYAIIDCGLMSHGELSRNQFLFVDLSVNKLIIGSKTNDVFVHYNHLIKRRIQSIVDPFTHHQYLLRFYTVEGVDQGHSQQTYVQIFMNKEDIFELEIIDVIDHTLLDLPYLSILDFQVHFNLIYLLVKNVGLYQIQFTATQRLVIRSFLPIKLNVNRFFVQQNGFNDDLHVVLANDNTIYQYTWDVSNPPVLVTKYALMANSVVQDLLMDQDFVIAQVWETVGSQIQRRTWVFSRRTLSYTNAYGSFKQPSYGPSIILYTPVDDTLHLIHEYASYNIKLYLPYLNVNPSGTQKAGQTEQYLVKATSKEGDSQVQCRLTFKFLYIDNSDTSIIKTGLQGRNQTIVDAPDETSYDLHYEFFGRNISYNVITSNVDNKTNSTTVPFVYVQKQVQASLNFPPQIDQSKITYYQMFLQNTLEEVEDKTQIFGIVQVQQANKSYPIYYIVCQVQIDAQFEFPSLKCRTLSKNNISMGRILVMSQMYSTKQRIGAIIFQAEDASVYLFQFLQTGFEFYGHKKFAFDYVNTMTGVQVTLKMQVLVTFQYGKRVQVYKIQDLHRAQEKEAQPIMVIDSRIMNFFGIQYFSPKKTKVSIYHDQVTFLQTKTGVLALNINEMGIPQLLFEIKTPTSKFDFEVNRDTLVIVTQTYMSMYRLTVPLRRHQPPFLIQNFNSDFNLNEYDEINSDGLFYLVQKQRSMLLVVHPNMPSTSVIYTEFNINNIKMMDAVRLNDKQVLFVYNGTHMLTWMFAQNPRLRIKWSPDQGNFTMNVTAYNQKSRSEPYSTLFSILSTDSTKITTTQKFNATAIRKAGHIQTKKNSKKFNLNITLNDTQWFQGNVMYYGIKCADCHKNQSGDNLTINIQNHLKVINTAIKAGQPTFDMQSTYLGIFGQMYDSVFKTFSNNDSIQYIIRIPTKSIYQVCTKIAVNPQQDYLLSFCQSGRGVNVYITTKISTKPVSSGPYYTQAQAVNHAVVVNNILMIVDNDDDPFNRAGGIYLYYMNISAKDKNDVLTMLDYLDYEDLQIQGFRGIPYIASADIHKPLFNKDQYAVFITQARTGNIFIFLFELSGNKQQAVYLQRRMLQLNKLIPESARHPTPLRVININIIDYTVKLKPKLQIQYILLLTVRNWHHIQLMFVVDQDYDLLSFQLTRLFERIPYPWELTNYIALRTGSLNASYFALSYRDYSSDSQVMVVYQLPYFALPSRDIQTIIKQTPKASIPVTNLLAAHRVLDTAEMCFAFNIKNQHRLLFHDVAQSYLSQLELNKQLKIIIKNADPTLTQGQNITVIAENHWTNISFLVQLKFNIIDDDDVIVEDNKIIWIIILSIGFVVIVGLVYVWFKQSKSSNRNSVQIKESLLTVQPEFKSNYINRSSADSESIRGTVDYTTPTPVEQKKLEKVVEEQQEDPIEQKIKNTEQQLNIKEQTKA